MKCHPNVKQNFPARSCTNNTLQASNVGTLAWMNMYVHLYVKSQKTDVNKCRLKWFVHLGTQLMRLLGLLFCFVALFVLYLVVILNYSGLCSGTLVMFCCFSAKGI